MVSFIMLTRLLPTSADRRETRGGGFGRLPLAIRASNSNKDFRLTAYTRATLSIIIPSPIKFDRYRQHSTPPGWQNSPNRRSLGDSTDMSGPFRKALSAAVGGPVSCIYSRLGVRPGFSAILLSLPCSAAKCIVSSKRQITAPHHRTISTQPSAQKNDAYFREIVGVASSSQILTS